MGLDNFWYQNDAPEGTPPMGLSFDPPLNLCGGMFSAHGEGSFRGKVYADLIHEVSEIDIYGDLSNEQVKQIADALEFQLTLANPNLDIHDLARMFRAYADAGAVLVAWY